MNELTNNSIIHIGLYIFSSYLCLWVVSLLIFLCFYIRGFGKIELLDFLRMIAVVGRDCEF